MTPILVQKLQMNILVPIKGAKVIATTHIYDFLTKIYHNAFAAEAGSSPQTS